MPTYNSDQETLRAVAVAGGPGPYPDSRLAATDLTAPLRISRFSYTSPASGTQPTTADLINLCTLPKGALILGGLLVADDMGTAPTLSVGTKALVGGGNASATRYASALDVFTAAATYNLGNTRALNFGDVLTEDKQVYATVGGGAFDASKKFDGYIFYVDTGA